jgi:hypothetical protein
MTKGMPSLDQSRPSPIQSFSDPSRSMRAARRLAMAGGRAPRRGGGYQACDGLTAAGDGDLFTALDLGQQFRQPGLGFVDSDFLHG